MWEVVNESVPDPKIGRWFKAWEMTTPAMEACDAAIRAWANFPESKQNERLVRQHLGRVSAAWRRAVVHWRAEGSPEDYGTHEHRAKIKKAKAKRAKAKRYGKKKD